MFLGFLLIGLLTRCREIIHGGNAARRAMRPILRSLGTPRQMVVARSGDAGYGLDNSNPWYTVHLLFGLAPDLDEVVTAAAREAGYQLDVDSRYAPDRDDARSRCLVAERDGRTLTVTITRAGPTEAGTPPAGYAFVALTLSLPPG